MFIALAIVCLGLYVVQQGVHGVVESWKSKK